MPLTDTQTQESPPKTGLEDEPRTAQEARWDENFAKLALRYAGGEHADVLYAPCGSTGQFYELLASRANHLHLVEDNPAKLESLLATHPDAKRWEPQVGEVANLPLTDQSVDLAFCMHHFYDLQDSESRLAALKELARVSRRYVAISVHDRATLSYIRKRIRSEKSFPDSLRMATILKEAAHADLGLVLKHPTLSLFAYQRSLLFEKTSARG
ncbi:MAG: class I SAM-dependent methyltransferase [Verrucomicrobiales bacterium]|nr:class I SAM-dependent methyltransferase [Verrucomicrobiales bacterium]